MRPYRLAVLGGTFDHLHVGHQALLATAFRVGEEVAVGVTTDRFVDEHPKPVGQRIQSYAVRRAALTRWVRRNFPGRRWRVSSLENPFGRSIDPEVGALVVSRDTERGGRAVNRERRRLGRKAVPLVVVPLALADDLSPVSSRRVRAGEIRTDGRRVSRIRVLLDTDDPRDRSPATRAVRSVFPSGVVVRPRAPERQGAARSDLSIRVHRGNRSGWAVEERTPLVRLPARSIRGSRPADLEWGLRAALRPRQ